jgi:hypothetical protein
MCALIAHHMCACSLPQVPKPKPPTKWEKFAKAKGIQKTKRSRMVFDEATDQYKPRYGYGRASNKDEWVVEAKGNEGCLLSVISVFFVPN